MLWLWFRGSCIEYLKGRIKSSSRCLYVLLVKIVDMSWCGQKYRALVEILPTIRSLCYGCEFTGHALNIWREEWNVCLPVRIFCWGFFILFCFHFVSCFYFPFSLSPQPFSSAFPSNLWHLVYWEKPCLLTIHLPWSGCVQYQTFITGWEFFIPCTSHEIKTVVIVRWGCVISLSHLQLKCYMPLMVLL